MKIKTTQTLKPPPYGAVMRLVVVVVEGGMARFYFHLASKESRILDERGKNFETVDDACEHAWKLVDKILLHVGYDDAKEWKVIISNDQHDGQIIIPFLVPIRHLFRRSKKTSPPCRP
jgi:hypothetical protein